MKLSRFTDSQIIAIFTKAEGGSTVLDLCREHRISDAAFLQMVLKVRRHGCLTYGPHEGAGGRELAPEEDVCPRAVDG